MDNINNFFKVDKPQRAEQSHYSGFRVGVIKPKYKKTRRQNTVVPIIRKSQNDLLNEWLDKNTPTKYMKYGKEGRSVYEFFNHDFTAPTQENNYIEPYARGDIDIKNSSIHRCSDEYSSGMSDFYEDKEVLFIPGSNRCSANLFYKHILVATHNYDTITPMVVSSPDGTEYFNEEIPFGLQKKQVYKMLMRMTNT